MQQTSNPRPTVMVSSTARDLPEHRTEVMDACLRQGMFPVMMEHLPASDAEAISASLKLVDEADIYVGVLAHRYGYVPGHDNPRRTSITEMEYDRAVERKIPRLIFVMDKTHPITIEDVEQGEAALKLKAFKERLQTENIVNFFNSPADLRADVINSLSQHRQPDLTTFHYVSDIPAPPEPFVAHPYTLLQTHRLVGRQPELNLLTDWVAKKDSNIHRARILNVVAVGGLGKSALTWHWFNRIAPQKMKPLAGRMWWSFYESDATFENFVTRALTYVSRRPLAEVQQIPAPERETQLLAALDREPFLLVLDGLERILIAYARMDAAHLGDDYDRQTANVVADAAELPASAAQSFTGEHRLRKTADPRAGSFLRKLANVRASRILVSTRLYPANLQTVTGEPLPGCAVECLSGLSDDGALELWRAIGVGGSRDMLLPLFNLVGNHPLLIQALASEVARYRPAPGDFDAWRRAHPDFDPFSLPLVNVKSHVLEFALRGLRDKERQALQVIAAFRMPARYDTLVALLIGKKKKLRRSERELDEVLTELEDRGLIGWDKRANRYDLHPIVRGVVWQAVNANARRGIFSKLHTYFDAASHSDYSKIESVDDLTPAIELYNALIGLKRFYEAYDIFSYHLEGVLSRLGASKLQIELLSPLVESTNDGLPRLENAQSLLGALTTIGKAFSKIGQLHSALHALRRAHSLSITSPLLDGPYSWLFREQSRILLLEGHLFGAQRSALDAKGASGTKVTYPESVAILGVTLAARGYEKESHAMMNNALASLNVWRFNPDDGFVMWALAQSYLWFKQFNHVLKSVDILIPDKTHDYDSNIICAMRLKGEAALGLQDFVIANEQLHHALIQARMINLVEEELPALVALAQLRQRQGEAQAARDLLDDVWEGAERGPYPLIHADAFNVLAQIERDAGDEAAAVEAATEAYKLAWCDGPPFAYHWGLEKARRHLRELGAGEPEMPAFDESKFGPMPEVEIDPADEIGAGSVGEADGEV